MEATLTNNRLYLEIYSSQACKGQPKGYEFGTYGILS